MREIWGLIPAAGKAKRLRRDAQGHLRKGPSKEILALPRADAATEGPARIACQDLLDNFRLAGVARALVLLRSGKWDIPKRLGDGGEFGVELAYRVLPAEQAARGVPFTLASAVPFLGDRAPVRISPMTSASTSRYVLLNGSGCGSEPAIARYCWQDRS